MLSPVKIWRNQKKLVRLIGKTGRIESFAMIRVAPSGFTDQAPYPVVLVRCDDGTSIMAQLVDWDQPQLTIGQKVTTVIRRIVEPNIDGVIPYGIKVKPI